MSVLLVLDGDDALAPAAAARVASWSARLTLAGGGRLDVLFVRSPAEAESAGGPSKLSLPDGEASSSPPPDDDRRDRGGDASGDDDDASGSGDARSKAESDATNDASDDDTSRDEPAGDTTRGEAVVDDENDDDAPDPAAERARRYAAVSNAVQAVLRDARAPGGRRGHGGGPAAFDLHELLHAKPERAALDEIAARTPRLVVLALTEPEPSKFARYLLERVESDVVGVHPGADAALHEGPMIDGELVVPMPGGTGRTAIELADRLRRGRTTSRPIHVFVDRDARARCRRTVRRIHERFGRTAKDRLTIDRDDDALAPRLAALLRERPGSALVAEVPARGDLAAARRLYEETVAAGEDADDGATAPPTPDLLIVRPGGRWAPTLRMRVVGRARRLLPALERDERRDLNDRLERGGRLGVDFMLLTILSTVLAGLGILRDSPAVVIGAMVVAPLMTPLVAAGLALAQGNLMLFRRALAAALTGIAAGLAAAFVLGLAFGGGPPPDELVARGEPGPLDFGIAIFSGVAGAWAVARPDVLGALVGVAIAVALVPPIAATGLSLAAGPTWVAGGAAVLFLTNLVAIVLGAAAVFRLVGIRPTYSGPGPGWVRATVLALALAGVALLAPLSATIDRARPDLVREAARAAAQAAGGDLVAVLPPAMTSDGPDRTDVAARNDELRDDDAWSILVVAPPFAEAAVVEAAGTAARAFTGRAIVRVHAIAPDDLHRRAATAGTGDAGPR